MDLDAPYTRLLNKDEMAFIRRVTDEEPIASAYIEVLNKMRQSKNYLRVELNPGEMLHDADAHQPVIEIMDDSSIPLELMMQRNRTTKEKNAEIFTRVNTNALRNPGIFSIFCNILFTREPAISDSSHIYYFNELFYQKYASHQFFLMLNNKLNVTDWPMYKSIIRPFVFARFKAILSVVINDDKMMHAFDGLNSFGMQEMFKLTANSIFRKLFVSGTETRPLHTFAKKDTNVLNRDDQKRFPDVSPHISIYESVKLRNVESVIMNYSEDVVMRFYTFFNHFPGINSFLLSPAYVNANLQSHLVGTFYDMLVRQKSLDTNDRFIELEHFKYWIIIMNAKNSESKSVPLVLQKSSFIEKYYPEYHAAEHFYFDMIETKDVDEKYKLFLRDGLPFFFLDRNQKEVMGGMLNNNTWKWTVDMLHYESDKKSFYDGWPNYHFRFDENYKQYLPGMIKELTDNYAADEKMQKSKAFLQKKLDFTFEKWAEQYQDLDAISLEKKYLIALLNKTMDKEDEKIAEMQKLPLKDPGVYFVSLFKEKTRMFMLWADSVLHYIRHNPLEGEKSNTGREFRIVAQHAEFVESTWYVRGDETSFFFKFLSAYYPGFLFCYYNDFDASVAKKNFFLDAVSTFAKEINIEDEEKQRFLRFSERLNVLRDLNKPYWVKEKIEEKKIELGDEIKALKNEISEIEPTDSMRQVIDSLQHDLDVKNSELTKINTDSKNVRLLMWDFGLLYDGFESDIVRIVLDWLIRMQAYLYIATPYRFRFYRNEPLLLFSVANWYVLDRQQRSETFPEFIMRNNMQLWYNSADINLKNETAFSSPFNFFSPSPYLDWLMWFFRQERKVLPMLTAYTRDYINDYLAVEESDKQKKERGVVVEKKKKVKKDQNNEEVDMEKEGILIDPDFIRNVIVEISMKSNSTATTVYYRHLPHQQQKSDVSYKINFNLIFYLLEHIERLNVREDVKKQLMELKDAFLYFNVAKQYREKITELSAKKINFGLTPDESTALNDLLESVKVKQQGMDYLVNHFVEYQMEKMKKNVQPPNIKFYGIQTILKRQIEIYNSVDMGNPSEDLLLLAQQKYRDAVEMQGFNDALLNFADNIKNLNYVISLIASHYTNGGDVDNVSVTPEYKVYFIRNLLYLIGLLDYWNEFHEEENARERIKRTHYVYTLICYRLIIRELAQAPVRHYFKRTKQQGAQFTFVRFMEKFQRKYANAPAVVNDIVGYVNVQQNEVAYAMIKDGKDEESAYTGIQKNNYKMYREAEYLMFFLKNVSYMYAPDLFDVFVDIFNANFINKFDPTKSDNENRLIYEHIPFSTGWLPVSAYNISATVPPVLPVLKMQDLMNLLVGADDAIFERSESSEEPPAPLEPEPPAPSEPEPSEESSSHHDMNPTYDDKTPVVKTEPAESSHSETDMMIRNVEFVDLVTPETSEVSMFNAHDNFRQPLATPEQSEVSRSGNNPFESSLIAPDEADRILYPPPLVLLPPDSRHDDIVLPRKRPITDVYGYIDPSLEKSKEARIAAILRTQNNVRLYEYTKENPPQLLIAAYHPHWYENMSPDMKKVFHEHPTVPIVLVSDTKVSAPLHKDLLTYRIPEVWVC